MNVYLKIISLLVFITTTTTYACTAFSFTSFGKRWMAKSYDFMFGDGMVIINKRNIKKGALLEMHQLKRGARWTSKYASSTFNTWTREMPSGGMNEEGLAIEITWDYDGEEDENVPDSKKPLINELQWLQYQLDNYNSVSEVRKHLNDLVLVSAAAPLHYFLCDLKECSVVEKRKSSLIMHNNLSINALTNDDYIKDVNLYSNIKDCNYPKSDSSQDRFVRTASLISKCKLKEPNLDYAFEILSSVDIYHFWKSLWNDLFDDYSERSYWNIVYDLKEKEIHFRTHDLKAIRSFSLSDFDPSCKTDVMVLPLNKKVDGDVGSIFEKYTTDHNRYIVKNSFGKWNERKDRFTPELMEFISIFPSKLPCTE